jgi:NAD dependent epimerase/dehydratase family enzyme
MPNFMVKMMFGEMGETLLLQGQHAVPDKLLKAGYEFKFPDLSNALKNILKK